MMTTLAGARNLAESGCYRDRAYGTLDFYPMYSRHSSSRLSREKPRCQWEWMKYSARRMSIYRSDSSGFHFGGLSGSLGRGGHR